LDPYGISCQEARWTPPGDLPKNLEAARARGEAAGAAAVIWYEEGQAGEVILYVVDLFGDKTVLRSLTVAGGGAERAMGAAGRTLQRARSLEHGATLPAAPGLSRLTGPPASAPSASAPAPRALSLALAYRALAFPGGGELEQGLLIGAAIP